MNRLNRFWMGVSLLIVAGNATADSFPVRYWPIFPSPITLIKSDNINKMPFAEQLMVQTLAGLVAYNTRETGTGEYVWLENGSVSYTEWLKREITYTKCNVADEHAFGAWELVDRYSKQRLIKGYILCRRDPAKRGLYEGKTQNTSVNVANALCGILSGIAWRKPLKPMPANMGLHASWMSGTKMKPGYGKNTVTAFHMI